MFSQPTSLFSFPHFPKEVYRYKLALVVQMWLYDCLRRKLHYSSLKLLNVQYLHSVFTSLFCSFYCWCSLKGRKQRIHLLGIKQMTTANVLCMSHKAKHTQHLRSSRLKTDYHFDHILYSSIHSENNGSSQATSWVCYEQTQCSSAVGFLTESGNLLCVIENRILSRQHNRPKI